MSDFRLHPTERLALEQFTAHSPDARLVIRAYALLWLDDEAPIQEIAQSLMVSRQGIYNWAMRFEERQGMALTAPCRCSAQWRCSPRQERPS